MTNAEFGNTGEAEPLPQWRFKLGFALLVISFVGLPLLGLILALFGVSDLAAVSGVMIVAAEVMMIAGAAIAGKEGFAQIKAKLFGYLKPLAPAKAVSRTRYRFGLVLFFLPLLFGWAAFYFADRIPAFETHYLAYGIAGDVMLAISLFVLGGEFWGKLRSLFIHDAYALIPKESA